MSTKNPRDNKIQASLDDYVSPKPYSHLTDYERKLTLRVEEHLVESVGGVEYLSAKDIASSTEMTPKTVGAVLPNIVEHSQRVDVSAWARTSSTTWQVVVR